LHSWRDMALQQAEENKTLKALMKYKDDSVTSFLTARVIAEAGGNFNNSVIVTAGSRDGVIKNMIAMSENGVVGRVVETGEWSARVLLYNDINFRLPVMLEGSQQRAILTGAGDAFPRLLYVPLEIELRAGTRVVTSGHGGLFPPNLPVGILREVKGQDILITPFARLDQLQMLRLVQYNLAGGEQNAMNQELKQVETAKPEAASVVVPATVPAPKKSKPVKSH
jgi:rod shape-determining protein MreC